jgi:hypothetical protein
VEESSPVLLAERFSFGACRPACGVTWWGNVTCRGALKLAILPSHCSKVPSSCILYDLSVPLASVLSGFILSLDPPAFITHSTQLLTVVDSLCKRLNSSIPKVVKRCRFPLRSR